MIQKRVSRGQRISKNLSASLVNKLSRPETPTGDLTRPTNEGISASPSHCFVVNTGTEDLDQWQVAKVTGIALDWDNDQHTDNYPLEVEAVGASESYEASKTYVITQRPVEQGDMGPAVFFGASIATANINDADHQFATIKDGVIETVGAGPLKLIYKDSVEEDGDEGLVLVILGFSASDIFCVDMVQDGGSDGGSTTGATWTYTIYNEGETENPLATLFNPNGPSDEFNLGIPTNPDCKYVRFPLGRVFRATAGLARFAPNGNLSIVWCNEVARRAACESEPAPATTIPGVYEDLYQSNYE